MSLLFLINCFCDPVTLKRVTFLPTEVLELLQKHVIQVGAKQSICESFIKANEEKEEESMGEKELKIMNNHLLYNLLK